METTFQLSAATIDAIENELPDAEIIESMAEDFRMHSHDLEVLLDSYCADDRGEVSHGSIEIDPAGIEIEEDYSGKIQLSFDEFIWMGCRDIEHESTVEATLTFSIDPSGWRLTVRNVDRFERDTDDI